MADGVKQIIFHPDAWLLINEWTSRTDLEISGFGWVERKPYGLYVYDITLLDMFSHGFTEIDPSLALEVNRDRTDQQNMKLWWHRHPITGWSGTDLNTIKNTPVGNPFPETLGYSGSVVLTPKGWQGRIDFYRGKMAGKHVDCEVLSEQVTPELVEFMNERWNFAELQLKRHIEEEKARRAAVPLANAPVYTPPSNRMEKPQRRKSFWARAGEQLGLWGGTPDVDIISRNDMERFTRIGNTQSEVYKFRDEVKDTGETRPEMALWFTELELIPEEYRITKSEFRELNRNGWPDNDEILTVYEELRWDGWSHDAALSHMRVSGSTW